MKYVQGKVVAPVGAWNSSKQPTMSLSSSEAEYRSMCDASKEAVWLRRLIIELRGHKKMESMSLLCENQSSIKIAHNLVFHARTKHIEVHYHFVRERVLSKEVDLSRVSTGE